MIAELPDDRARQYPEGCATTSTARITACPACWAGPRSFADRIPYDCDRVYCEAHDPRIEKD